MPKVVRMATGKEAMAGLARSIDSSCCRALLKAGAALLSRFLKFVGCCLCLSVWNVPRAGRT